jgi:glutamate 5-kinase
LLILLSVVDGIGDASGQPLRLVRRLSDVAGFVRPGEKTPLGKGGMNSKLEAARIVTASGEAMIVADGRMPDVLPRLLAGEELGTMFLPASRKRAGRGRWIGSARAAGTIVVDDGAARALVEKNRSLLAAGIVRVDGAFARGDVVAIVTSAGQSVARGLTNYAAADLEQIRGKKTADVRALIKECAYDEVVHRDNLVLL